ncbi:lysylphosphatidylglycerol synthase domain-containing protein [uncultured Alteromonas sp.]|jgi:uncharacterized membrane protein YbhN (UPF0104 family)|uniref:lysylphosphatidylglycerol synthase domain-containing protein n=1 Tax=uncultured Alteromonas sp. TaxID=179113 RepID=UPI0025CFEA44|nr:lysylphosphatidylglycerol synthase domain-containing protein [uncultured Alteromonas sp.]
MKRIIQFLLPSLLLILTLAAVEWFVGWQTIARGFVLLPGPYLWSAMALMLFSYVLRTWRIQASLMIIGHFTRLFKLSLTHNILNIMMPMRTGEASFPIFMKAQFSVPMLTASLHLIMFRLLDLLCLLCIGGVLLLWRDFPLLSVVITGLFVVVIMFTEKLKLLALLLLRRTHQPLLVKLRETLAQLPTKGKTYVIIALLTLTSWLSKLSAFVLIVLGISELSFHTALLGIVGADLSSVLPIHGVAGSGTFEGAFILAAEMTGLSNLKSSFPELLEASVQLHVFLLASAASIYALSIVMVAANPLPASKS